MNNVISTNRISKCYGHLSAVDDVSLNIFEGEIYGFLGLNGAGKTTMIKMLLGMIKPTRGNAYINGALVNAGNYKLWENVGYMVEMPNAYPELTVYENLEIVRKLRHMSDSSASIKMMKTLSLTEHANKKVRTLSLGNKQRLGIAKALIHMPKILILDEPTNGLDPSGVVEIRNLLKNLASNQGVTILISSHLLSEISKTATRVGIIHEGKLISEFDASRFEQLRNKKVILTTTDNKNAQLILSKNGYIITNSNDTLECIDEKAASQPEHISELLASHGCYLKSLLTEYEDLESYFLRLISRGGV